MDDLISRQRVREAIEGTDWYSIKNGKLTHGAVTENALYKATDIYKVLKKVPPAEPKRGKWIEDKGQQTLMKNFIEKGEVWRVCSVCGAGHMIGHKYAIDKAYHDRYHNFCPNCGAKMEVDNDS